MKIKKIAKNLFNNDLHRFFYKIQRIVLNVIFISFIFAAFHSAIHNDFNHIHDSNCSVYVLEQLYFGADVVSIASVFILFLPFIVVSFIVQRYSFKTLNYFNIRAPPPSPNYL